MSQDKEREALDAAHRLYEWAFNGWEACKVECDRLRDELAALATQPPAVQGEPFCYHHQLVLNDSSGIIDSETNSQPTMEPWLSGCRVETIPLYTSPPSREVEPLTDEQLWRMRDWLWEKRAVSLSVGTFKEMIAHGIHSRGEGES